MTNSLDGQVAIVTGAAQGIGQAIAKRLLAANANVIVADIQADEIDAVAKEFDDSFQDGMCHGVECDVTSIAATQDLAAETINQFGQIDILINNAGIGSGAHFEALEPDDWHAVLDVNLNGPFNCAKAVVPTMIDQEYGRIVNISSMAGRNISYHGYANYTASKWGLIGLTKHLAWDLGKHDITVNAVCPGSTLTPLIKSATTSQQRAQTSDKIPLNRWATPEDQAEGVMYLVSDAGSYVTGTVLEIDGGKQLGVRHEI